MVSGSANFSRASTTDNDENMIIIRGDRRVADIYFTEFNRLFFHYYFRSVVQRIRAGGGSAEDDALDLVEDDPGPRSTHQAPSAPNASRSWPRWRERSWPDRVGTAAADAVHHRIR